MNIIDSITGTAAEIQAVRRDIHAHPELCFEERRTADVIADTANTGVTYAEAGDDCSGHE